MTDLNTYPPADQQGDTHWASSRNGRYTRHLMVTALGLAPECDPVATREAQAVLQAHGWTFEYVGHGIFEIRASEDDLSLADAPGRFEHAASPFTCGQGAPANH